MKWLVSLGLLVGLEIGFAQQEGVWEEFYSKRCKKTIELKRFGTNKYDLRARTVWVRFDPSEGHHIFDWHSSGQFYDSMWVDYKSKTEETITFWWDDGNPPHIFDGYQIRDCSYTLKKKDCDCL